MNQIAWLDFYGGIWHLVTGDAHEHQERWLDEETALRQLRAEGWEIDGPHGRLRRNSKDNDLQFYGYALTRVLH
jgi:hypothetical protein